MATFDIGAHRICFAFPRLITEVSSWHGHIPFAFLCAELLRPRTFVELGSFKGDSYCAFNQAFEELGVAKRILVSTQQACTLERVCRLP